MLKAGAGESYATAWAWRLFGCLPPAAARAVDALWHDAAALAQRRLPVTRTRGELAEGGGAASVVVVDEQPSVTYFVRQLFEGDVQADTLPPLAPCHVGARLDELAQAADLVLVRMHARLGQRRLGAGYLRVPEAVKCGVAIPEDGGLPERARRSHRDNLRLMRREKLTPLVSHDPADFERFYRQLYVPFARQRFGELAYVRSPQRVRQAFRRGGLLWVCKDGQRAAGLVYDTRGDTLLSCVLGTDEACDADKRAVATATYAFALELAHRMHMRTYDLGGSRPSLTDGVLAYKKRWGAALSATQPARHDLFVRWELYNGAVARLLGRAPLIVRDGAGLAGVAALSEPTSDAALRRQVDRLWMAGLRRLFVLGRDVDEVRVETVRTQHDGAVEVRLLPAGSSAEVARRINAEP